MHQYQEQFKTRGFTDGRLAHAGFPGGSVVESPPVSAGDTAPIPELGRASGEANGSRL